MSATLRTLFAVTHRRSPPAAGRKSALFATPSATHQYAGDRSPKVLVPSARGGVQGEFSTLYHAVKCSNLR